MLNATNIKFIPPFKPLNPPIIVPVLGQLVPTVVPTTVITTAPPTVIPPGQLVPTKVAPSNPMAPIPTAPTIPPIPPTTSVPTSPPPVITYSPTPQQPNPVTPFYNPPTTNHTGGSDSFFEDDWYNTPSYSSQGSNTLRVQSKYNTLEYDRPQYRVATPRHAAPYASRPLTAYNMGCPNPITPQNNSCNSSFGNLQGLLPLLMNFFSSPYQHAVPACSPFGTTALFTQQHSGPIFNFNFNFGSNHNF